MLAVIRAFQYAVEEGAEESSGLSLILPESAELWAGIIAFGIVFFFMWKYAVPTLNKTLEGRQHAIKSQLESAEASKVEAEKLLADYREQVANASTEADRIIDEARDRGETVRTEIIARAEQEAEAIKSRAAGEIQSERSRAADALREEVKSLSLDVAQKVVGGSLDRGAQEALVDRFIEELGGIRS